MNSKELQAIQTYLTKKLGAAVKSYDFDTVEALAKEIKVIDRKRRKAWHKEKFGAYEDMADNVLAMFSDQSETFTSEDFPF